MDLKAPNINRFEQAYELMKMGKFRKSDFISTVEAICDSKNTFTILQESTTI